MLRLVIGQLGLSLDDKTLQFWRKKLFETCEGVGLVKRVHTLLGGVHRLATSLKEVEEVREEVREVEDEDNRDQSRGRVAQIMSACGWDD